MRAVCGVLITLIYMILVGLFTGGLKGIYSNAGSIDRLMSAAFGITVSCAERVELCSTAVSGWPAGSTPKGRTLIISNHPSFLDGFVLFQWATRNGLLPRIRFIVADWVKKWMPLPFGLGDEHLITVKRSWAADKTALEKAVAALPADAILIFFPEGTTFCPESLEKSVDFARKNRLPVFRHLLCPRTRGLEHVLHLCHWDTILNMTIHCPGRAINPFYGSDFNYLLQGTYSREYHVLVEAAAQPPPTGIEKWLMGIWREKDEQLERLLRGY